MLVDVTHVLTNPKFARNFTIHRKTDGEFIEGEWVQGEKAIKMYGPVQPSGKHEINMVPEADRVSGLMTFWSKKEIKMSGKENLSDELEYRGDRYKVLAVIPWYDNGWCKAIATKMGVGL